MQSEGRHIATYSYRFRHTLCVALSAVVLCALTHDSYAEPPKREMRAAWIATVWALDWPKTTSGSWTTKASQQQQLLTQMLDSLQAMNMNCIALHCRTMSDAWYESKYEPWSQWITGTRGQTPTYDPLAFALTEAHKRGMEVHVWLNPYRYASSAAQYNTNKALANDYANTHPEWLMTVGDATILNPGLPAVKTRICEVVADILEKYDIDGVLFDDYFYLSGTPNSLDASLYQNNNPQNLSQADWRREQVNEMVRRVHDTILVTKPWVTFGIGPAPQVASSAAHAAQYDVPQGPFSDWQYNSINSDPLAWMSRRTIDYIAPQMYWHVGSSTCDFSQLSAWWSMVAEKFGRHFYASNSVEDSKAAETIREVNCLRKDDLIDAPGSVMYSIHNGIYKTSSFTRTMRNGVWQSPALPPQQWWNRQQGQLYVSNITLSAGKLYWNAPANNSNVRYAVYYLPNDSIGRNGQFYSSRWLLGMTYNTSFTVPQKSNYSYAVSVIDRYGNEYAPMIRGYQKTTAPAPVLTYPADGALTLLPAWFTWSSSTGTDSWFVEIARDSLFSDIISFAERGEPRFYTGDITLLKENVKYWWRVTARTANADDAVSSPRSFTGSPFAMLSPTDGQRDVSLTPMLVCDSVAEQNATYKFEVATKNSFGDYLVFSKNTIVPRVQIPDSVLAPGTYYYARVSFTATNMNAQTTPISFRTEAAAVLPPVIISPEDGDTVTGPNVTLVWTGENASSYRAELSTLNTFAPRVTKGVSTDAYTTQATITNVSDGDYFVRIRATGDTDYVYSDVITITVKSASAVDDINESDRQVQKLFINGQLVIVMPDGTKYTAIGTKIDR